MFVVYVELRVIPDRMDEFLPMMLANARGSLETESGCLQFDVVRAQDDDDLVQLVEVYTDEAAFKAHQTAAHYKTFSAEADDLIRAKRLRYGTKIFPT
ncbi:antibiotic biosynthesis monooxygenase [Aliishimia ponticola]|uniref:Antibiotic biosynthesis monooxygenase n=1 Tax=Aliishimia ponticola TaxID=2499833 RepID=A0A4S4NG19_9RHOB|nr:putative quinol monooxygenase [Aliishimia ponticola]THH37071.1 antibiotic biosynthesis monooxygenase [Aliishimia ponticola]